jgi:hypothetical protein
LVEGKPTLLEEANRQVVIDLEEGEKEESSEP